MQFALFAAALYGLSYIIYSWSSERASFSYLMFFGSIYCAILSAPFALKEKIDFGVLKAIAFERSIWLLASFFIYTSIKKTGAAVTSTVESTYPFFVMLLAALIYKEKIQPSLFIGGAFILTGLAIIVFNSKEFVGSLTLPLSHWANNS